MKFEGKGDFVAFSRFLRAQNANLEGQKHIFGHIFKFLLYFLLTFGLKVQIMKFDRKSDTDLFCRFLVALK